MGRHTSRWHCPKCDQTITIHIRIHQPPICHHWHRRALPPTPMDQTDD